MLSYENHLKKMNDVSSRAYIGLPAKLDILMNNQRRILDYCNIQDGALCDNS